VPPSKKWKDSSGRVWRVFGSAASLPPVPGVLAVLIECDDHVELLEEHHTSDLHRQARHRLDTAIFVFAAYCSARGGRLRWGVRLRRHR